MSPLAIAYSITMLVVIVVFIVEAIRFRAEVGKYARAGLWLGVMALLIDLAFLLSAGDSIVLDESTCIQVVVIDALLVVKLALFAAVGLHCGAALGYPSAPLVMRVFGPASRTPAPADEGQAESSGKFIVHEVQFLEESTEPEQVVASEQPGWSAGLAWTLVLVGGSVLHSYLLFAWTKPRLSEALQQALEISESSLTRTGITTEPTVQVILVVCAFAFGEEILFRLGIQNFLAQNLKLRGAWYGVAIFIAAAIWSLAHANTLDPEWVKFAQVFPIGVGLGLLFRKFGVEICILAHCVFNVVMVYLAPHMLEI